MPSTCSVVGCNTGHGKCDEKHACFIFPKSETFSQKWVEKINRKNFKPNQNSRVCSKHFSADCFDPYDCKGRPRKIKRLKDSAVPSLFLRPGDSTGETPSVKKRKVDEHNYFSSDTHEKEDEQQLPTTQDMNMSFDSSDSDVIDFDDIGIQCEINISQKDPEKTSSELASSMISSLEEEVAALKKENLSIKAKLTSFERIFNEDQFERMVCPGSRKPFSLKTLQECIHIYYSCGSTAYELLREKGFPFPCARTLRRHLEGLDTQPGTQKDFISMMKKKVEKMSGPEKFCGLAIDEMSICPKIEYDSTTQSYKGHPTIPPGKTLAKKRQRDKEYNESRGYEANDDYAYHAMNVLLCGQTVRYKQLIGYHFTDNSFDEKIFCEWLLSLIKEVKDTLGLVICSVTTDMGPCNINV